VYLSRPRPAIIICRSTMTPRKTIADSFAELRQRKQLGFVPFISAGYPDLDTTAALLPALEQAGANVIEIGLPFSDPIADGPTIQQSFVEALAKKIRLSDIFNTVRSVRGSVSIPLVAMGSFSMVYRFGVDRFIATAKESGLDGLILPDLPPPEAQAIVAKIRNSGLDTILLVAPTTTPQRRQEIVDLCSGFVYYLSVSGITGERTSLPQTIATNVAALKAQTTLPIAVGFGISAPEHLAQLAGTADAAIVGSAIVKQITQHKSETPAKIASHISDYCRNLLAQVRA
jgi:tryptophan synthase alpha chain